MVRFLRLFHLGFAFAIAAMLMGCALGKNDGANASSNFQGILGSKLYQNNCASCHNPLENSSKKDRTFDQIWTAMDVPQMVFLKAQLTESDVRAIALVLKSNADFIPPSQVQNLRLMVGGPSTINLAWDASTDTGGAGLEGYHIFRNGTLLTTVDALSTSHSDTQLTPSTDYSYEIEAYDRSANLAPKSTVVRARTLAPPPVPDILPPSVPNLTLTVISATRIKIDWPTSSDAGGSGLRGYQIFRNSQFVADLTSDKVTYLDTNLSANFAYTYEARAIDNANNMSEKSAGKMATTLVANGALLYVARCTTCHVHGDTVASSNVRNKNGTLIANAIRDVAAMANDPVAKLNELGNDEIMAIANALSDSSDNMPPTTPGNFNAAPSSATQITLTWNASTDSGGSGLNGYRIFRNGTMVHTSAVNETSYLDGGLTPNTSYAYQIEAYDKNNNKSAKASKSATTLEEVIIDTTPPSAPVVTTTVISATRISLAWPASTDNTGGSGVQSYKISRNGGATIVLPANVTTYLDRNLSSQMAYNYKVTAVDVAGNESLPGNGFDASTPVANGAALYVASCTSCHAHGDTVLVSSKRNRTAPQITAAIANEAAMKDTDPNVESVMEKLGPDEILAIALALSDTSDNLPPSTPGSFNAVAGSSTQMTLSWTTSTDTGGSGLNGYKIYRGTSLIRTAPPTDTSFVDGGLAPDTSYSYQIEAFDRNNNPSVRASKTARTLTVVADDDTPPTAPAVTIAALSATRLQLTWPASTDTNGSGVAGYQITRTGQAPIDLPANITTYVMKNLSAATSYSFFVTASDVAGNRSAPGNGFSRQTPAANGTTLYAATCTSCHAHGDTVLVSTKRNKSAAQISAAIANEPAMKDTDPNFESAMEKLGADEINAIASALSDTSDDIDPTPPASFTAAAQSSTQILLGWTAATDTGGSGLNNYRVYRGSTLIHTGAVGSTSYLDSGRAPGTSYTYKIEATDRNNNVSTQRTATATTQTTAEDDNTPPSVPTVSVAVLSATRLQITWTASTDNTGGSGVAKYLLTRSGQQPIEFPANIRSYIDKNLSAATAYSYSVKAVDVAENQSNASPSVSRTTLAVDGPALYTANCGECHGPTVAGSAKRNKTQPQISTAINSNPGMADNNEAAESDLEKLGLDEIIAIATALSDAADTVAPTLPGTFRAVASSATQIDLSWTASTDASSGLQGYRIFRTGSTTALATLPANALGYTDANRTPNTAYAYQIEAYDKRENKAAKVSASATTPEPPEVPDTTPPNNPPNVAASAYSATRIIVTWGTATDNEGGSGVKAYVVRRNGRYLAQLGASVRTYTDIELAANGSYVYSVSAVDNVNLVSSGASVTRATPAANGAALYASRCQDCHTSPIATTAIRNRTATQIRNAISGQPAMVADTAHKLFELGTDEIAALVKALANSQDTTAPSAPGAIQAVVGVTQVNLIWGGSVDNTGGSGIKYYRVYANDQEVTVTRSAGFVQYGLTPGTAYTYKVKAYDQFDNASAFGPALTISTKPANTVDSGPPTAPATVNATPAPYTVSLSWTAATDDVGVMKYYVYRGATRVLIVNAPILSGTDRLLQPSTEYEYQVSAVDFFGKEGPKSAVKRVTTLPPVGEQLYVSRNCYSCHGLPPDLYITGQLTAARFFDAAKAIMHPTTGHGPMQGMPAPTDADLTAIATWAMTLQAPGEGRNPSVGSEFEYRVPLGTRTYLAGKLRALYANPASEDTNQTGIIRSIDNYVTRLPIVFGGPCTPYDGFSYNSVAYCAGQTVTAPLTPVPSAGRVASIMSYCEAISGNAYAMNNVMSRVGLSLSDAVNYTNVSKLYSVYFPGMPINSDRINQIFQIGVASSAAGQAVAVRWGLISIPMCEAALTEGF